jgi:hypothetical protein
LIPYIMAEQPPLRVSDYSTSRSVWHFKALSMDMILCRAPAILHRKGWFESRQFSPHGSKSQPHPSWDETNARVNREDTVALLLPSPRVTQSSYSADVRQSRPLVRNKYLVTKIPPATIDLVLSPKSPRPTPRIPFSSHCDSNVRYRPGPDRMGQRSRGKLYSGVGNNLESLSGTPWQPSVLQPRRGSYCRGNGNPETGRRHHLAYEPSRPSVPTWRL